MARNWNVLETRKFRENGYITIPKSLRDKVVFNHEVWGESTNWGVTEDEERDEKYLVLSNEEIGDEYGLQLKRSDVTGEESQSVRPPSKAYEEVGVDPDVEDYAGFLSTEEMIEEGVNGQYMAFLLFHSQISDMLPDTLGFGYSTDIPEEKLYEAAEMLPEFR